MSSLKSGTGSARRIEPQSNLRVTSIAASFKIGCDIDLDVLKYQIVNFEYSPKRHNAMTIRQRDPRVTFLLFSSGSCVITGAVSEESNRKAIRIFLRKLQKLGYGVKYTGYQINSVSGAFNTGFGVDISQLNDPSLGRLVYVPERFSGGLLHYKDKRCAMVFHTGAVTMSGTKSIEELEDDYPILLSIINKAKK